jgi:PHD/YefM family antitoxin component YafN of YafNO toxin-antitoxin module
MADPARTSDPEEALDLVTAGHEPVIIERDGNDLAAVIPIELFRKWSSEEPAEPPALLDELLEISRSVPDDEWAKLPEDGAENVDRYLHRKRP